MPAETITTYETYTVDAQIRMQCLEMANRQTFNTSASEIVAAAQKLYGFVVRATSAAPEKQAHGF